MIRMRQTVKTKEGERMKNGGDISKTSKEGEEEYIVISTERMD